MHIRFRYHEKTVSEAEEKAKQLIVTKRNRGFNLVADVKVKKRCRNSEEKKLLFARCLQRFANCCAEYMTY